MKAHFVTFFSPGTIMAEQTTMPIESWDINEAVAMAGTITERYAARPYGFRFSTRERGDADLDSKITEQSGYYYLGGVVETLADIEARNDPREQVLIDNMRCNGWSRVVTNRNSYKACLPLKDDDVVLDVKLPPLDSPHD